MASCNICGNTEFRDYSSRKKVFCPECKSVERTRAIYHIIEKDGLLNNGSKVLHFAPELGLANYFRKKVGDDNYSRYDKFPDVYDQSIGVKEFDLTTDVVDLPSDHFDLILHVHVLEHLPCWIAPVLWHLQRALKPGGTHLFAMPIDAGSYREDLGRLSDEDRLKRFGQKDHVRVFGQQALDSTLGMVIDLKKARSRLDIPEDEAERHNFTLNEVKKTFFRVEKGDLLLR